MSKNRLTTFASELPAKLGPLLVGLVMVVNAEHVSGFITDVKWSDMAHSNLRLLGGILIGLGCLKILVDWYMAHAAPELGPLDRGQGPIE